MFEGTHTALVTPFTEKGVIDTDSFREIIEDQIQNGIKGVVPVGTTGEASTLSVEEHNRAIQIAVNQSKGRCMVIAGTGSNSTAEAINLTQSAENSGVDAVLIVTPYYNKPSQEGIFKHYYCIANSTQLPIILYSIPGRCHIQIEVETVVRLSEKCNNICAIKEASGKVSRVKELRSALPESFEILSGDDALTVDFMKEGAIGLVSVASNLMPKVMSELTEAINNGDYKIANDINEKYNSLFSCFLTLDTNPVPIKQALSIAGKCRSDLRLPMTQMSDDKVEKLRQVLINLDII